jgi:hypothetical protein
MSSVNTTFQPLGQTIVVDNSAAAQCKDAVQKGASTFRCVARVANAYLKWGRASTIAAPAAPAAIGAVALGQNDSGVIGLTKDVPIYIDVPPDSFFISSAVFATSNVEITPGIGGVGG